MERIRVIKNNQDYEEALKSIETLMQLDPSPDSEEGEKLSLLSTLVEEYESKVFVHELPDPIEAIEFRMEQEGLKPVDLVPYIGSRSKVSEILSGKRSLTLSMIRALEKGLGIPAKVLIKEPVLFKEGEDVNWSQFPIKEMLKRGYFESKTIDDDSKNLSSIMSVFFSPIGTYTQIGGMLRTSNYRSNHPINKHALIAWSARVAKKALSQKITAKYKKGSVNLNFMKQVAQLSRKENGPILAQKFLKENGVALIIEPHLPNTYLDGVSIMLKDENPVIGLTIRLDRLDNFWFTLMHELAHLSKHFIENHCFYDDLDDEVGDEKEKEADKMASEALIPESAWESSPARIMPSEIAAEMLAEEVGVHEAIVAGRMRHEIGQYKYLSEMVNRSKVRHYFKDINWI